MTLGEKQELFMLLLPRLIDKAHALGVQIRGGELLRTEAQARRNATTCRVCGRSPSHRNHLTHLFKPVGIVNSLHRRKLAFDLNLFRDGTWLRDGTDPVYKKLGDYWKNLHPLCCWGGDFRNPDPGHFSITHLGRK